MLTCVDPEFTLQFMPSSQPWSIVRASVARHFEREVAEERRRAEELRAGLLQVLRPLAEYAIAAGVCKRVWLFGSYAWGLPSEASDVDLLVDGDSAAFGALVMERVKLPVHIIDFAPAPNELRDRVIREGQSL